MASFLCAYPLFLRSMTAGLWVLNSGQFLASLTEFEEGINEIANVANVPTDGDGRMTS